MFPAVHHVWKPLDLFTLFLYHGCQLAPFQKGGIGFHAILIQLRRLRPRSFGGFGGGGEDSQPQRPKRERKPRKAIGNAFTRTLINLGVTLLFGLGYFYFELPALNPHAEEFYVFLFLLCAVYCICAVLTSGFQGEGVKGYFGFVKKQCTIPFFVVIAMIAAVVIGGLTSWVVIRAGSYSELLPSRPATSPQRWRRSPTTRSPCWTRTPPSGWAAGCWAS